MFKKFNFEIGLKFGFCNLIFICISYLVFCILRLKARDLPLAVYSIFL